LADTLIRRLALPVPEAGSIPVIHGTSLRADQAQPFGALSVTTTWWSAASTAIVKGDTSYRHGAAPCVIATSCCATIRRPWRGVPSGLGRTEYVTVAGPWPDCTVRLTHDASAEADHVQSRDVATLRLPFPPLAGISGVLLVTLIWHLSPVGATTLVLEDPHASAAHEVASNPARRTVRLRTRAAFMVDRIRSGGITAISGTSGARAHPSKVAGHLDIV
jgi:hypothetical protein